jgi:hypothetical protein
LSLSAAGRRNSGTIPTSGILVVVVGLVANLLLAAWWVDAVTSLGIVWFVVKKRARGVERGGLPQRRVKIASCG